ncbi:MAG: 30S ribosomal protein S4, small subunit ribosomal protein S4 [Deltaproteobacteria bacterium CSP1-8]|nr:MAG: 30S ribosomal protein S4, small subunit ribosomal protein S4 [Deltaproteobacteria bacterium CSP1-8]
MARYREAVCRLCRREGMELYLKGDRCFTDKCAIKRRGYPPGQHGQRRPKHSDYGVQLREKQKARRIYGLLEKQFHNYFEKADRMKGRTGDNLLILLERRLDNVVFKLGFAVTRRESRQLVRHGHFLVAGRRVNIPSYLVRPGDVVEIRERSRKILSVNEALDAVARKGIPVWLELERENFRGSVKALPSRADITEPIQEQLIVELYSK